MGKLKNLYPISHVPKRVSEITDGTKKVHTSTTHRWRQRGIKGIKLRTIMIGGDRYCCDEWLLEFFEATTRAKDKTTGENIRQGRLTAQREREIERAEQELDEAGV
ncbi:MAG: DUF1580 domain-containing protein [Planctomycetales bacterium]|nr:DUF1580 domain-containing protein [Planctomycetales bacterium]